VAAAVAFYAVVVAVENPIREPKGVREKSSRNAANVVFVAIGRGSDVNLRWADGRVCRWQTPTKTAL
jgi:hypothetical protein